MRAETAERQVEDKLLVPMVHVERSITRGTTILSVEIPEDRLLTLTDRRAARKFISSVLSPIGDTFLEWWDRSRL